MKFYKHLVPILSIIFINFLIGCGGGGGSSSPGTGNLSLGLTDSSTLKYTAVYVTIDEVQVNKRDSASNGNAGWTTVAIPQRTYNLLSLVNGLTEILGDSELEAGTYRQIRLIIGKQAESENNILGLPHPYANYIILKDGADTIEELKIPSGLQTGLKLVHNFQVLENTVVELVLDFDACRSVVETGNNKYLMKPTIRVIETENKSTVYGDVLDSESSLPITGAFVSAQVSEGLSSTVVRSTLTSDGVGEEGQYSLLLSPNQQYNIVAYSDQKVGEPGSEKMYDPACVQIDVPINSDPIHDFSLTTNDYGTISGSVEISGNIDPDNPPVVYISFFTELGCGYVEVLSIPMSPAPGETTFSYSTDLPLGVYHVVATCEGFVPDSKSANGLVVSGETLVVDLNL